MTDSRKVQLETVLDNSGAKQGFQELKNDARDMAQAVGQAGQQAGAGLAKVGDGAKAAGDSWTREEGRIRAAIQRSTLELQTLGKTASQKFEAKIDFQGLDPTKFQSYIAALREAEQAQVRLAAAQRADGFVSSLREQVAALREQVQLQGLSADEALRFKAAQAGAAEAAAPLILQIQNMRAAQEAAAQAAREEAEAQKQAAAALAKRDSFVESLRQQADAVGKTRSQLLEMQAAQLGVTKEAAPYIARLREAEGGQQKLGAATKLSAFQTQQLGYQVHDFVVQVASGQSALTAFVQQGSQLSGTFGGAKNAFQAVLSLLTPIRVGMLAAAAGVGVLAAELVHAETSLRQVNTLQAQLAATGRAGLFSDVGLKDYIKELSLAPGVTREVATSIISELSKAHDIGGGLFRDLGKLAVDYAKATGNTVPAAAASLAKAFSDPAQGAKELDKALGTLTSTQLLAIERLARQGDILAAQRALYDALAQSVKGLADRGTTPLQKSISDLGNAWDRAMDRLDHSEGLRNINALLAKTISSVQWLVDNAPKLGGLGNIGLSVVPGALPGALGTAAGNGIRSAVSGLFTRSSGGEFPGTGATGSFDVPATGAAGSAGTGKQPSEDVIKRQLEVARGYQSEAGRIADLTEKRQALNKALADSNALYGTNSDQSKRLREGIAGIGEEIRNLAKKGNSETQGVIDAALQGQIKAAQDALQRERESVAFQQRYLAGQYQAGEVSVVEFYDRKRQAIAAGVAAEVAELEKERAAVQAHLAGTVDSGKQQQDRERLSEIDRKQADLRTQAGREVQLANQEQIASYKQLADQLASYRADLLQLQGDEVGAARVRAQQALLQAGISARQSAGSPGAISEAELEAQRVALEQTLKLNAAKNASGIINQALQLQEAQIADAQRRGATTSTEAMTRAGEARRQAVAQLEEVVKAQEEVAKSRPQDYQLQIDTAQARQQLEQLKDQLDPLAEHFRSLFSDATGNLFADLANDPKNAKDAVKKWLTGIMGDINAQLGKDLSAALFAKGGPLGDIPGAIGDLFRKGARTTQERPLVDTSGVTQSLTALQTSGLDPATAALNQFTASLQTATAATGGGAASTVTTPTTGDFTRLDRASPTTQAADEEAQQSARRLTATNEAAAGATIDLAIAAARGGDALSLLPQIIAIIKAAAASDGGGVGGGIGGLIASLFTGGSGGGSVNLGTATGADLALFYAGGGYTGDVDPNKAAGIVHGREFVFDAKSTAMIGRETLERMQRAAQRDPAQAASELIARVRGKREFGGPVDSGGIYEVNERRPEVLTIGRRDYLMMGAQSGKVQAAASGGDIHIVNNLPVPIGKVEKREGPNGERVMIIQQAVEAMAASLNDPNSRVSRSMKTNYAVTRNR